MPDEKPYRPNVGTALFNASGDVLIGRRFRDDGPEIILPGLEWQMPQGGIDADEKPRDAGCGSYGRRPARSAPNTSAKRTGSPTSSRPMTVHRPTASPGFAASAKNGS